jgi:hypothetical protein
MSTGIRGNLRTITSVWDDIRGCRNPKAAIKRVKVGTNRECHFNNDLADFPDVSHLDHRERSPRERDNGDFSLWSK